VELVGGSRKPEKGRLIQERDRVALAWIGLNRVLTVETLARVAFPGRDQATVDNRIRELARDIGLVGAYLNVHRRTREDGSIERYLSLTEAGYQQAESVLGAGFFLRTPTEPLKPSHIQHDLELADFAVSLFPSRRVHHQPLRRGRPAGEPIELWAPFFSSAWRWRHASVFTRTIVLEGRRTGAGQFQEKPKVSLVYEADAVLETDTFNCTRYFIEFDRGTESLVGEKEKRTILDKLRRIRAYFWLHGCMPRDGFHWSESASHYRLDFKDSSARRPKILFVTLSARRGDGIRTLAEWFFRDDFTTLQLQDFLEVAHLDDARRKLQKVTRMAESRPVPSEWPWAAELRERDSLAAANASRRAAEDAARAAEAARRSPLWVPYKPATAHEAVPVPLLSKEEAQALLEWADDVRSRVHVSDYSTVTASMFDLLDGLRVALHPLAPLARKAGALLGANRTPSPFPFTLSGYMPATLFHWVSDIIGDRDRRPDLNVGASLEAPMARLMTRLIFLQRLDPAAWSGLVLWAKANNPDDSLWSRIP
jgi:hypothetical protein